MSLMAEASGRGGFWIPAAAVAAFITLGVASAVAQDTQAPAADTPPTTEQPASAVEQPDWTKICGEVNGAQECHISRHRLAATGQPLAQFMIIERPEKKHLQITVPPVVLITEGINVTIDGAEQVRVSYVACVPSGCLAMGEITDEYIAKLKAGGTLVMTIVNPQGKPVNFDISLAGFTASYDGPGLDPQEAQARQQRLEDELQRKADEARQQLLQLQQQQSSTQ
jgi:invasion protein IalB